MQRIPVYEDYITKHLVFSMAEDGSTEPKKVGEYLTKKSMEGYDLVSKYVDFCDGKLHIYVALKGLKERKVATPPGTLNTRFIGMPG
jgi:hypothetical protein